MLLVQSNASCSAFLVVFKGLILGAGDRLVKLTLTGLVNSTGLSIKSTGVVTQSLVLFVFGTSRALKADARLASALSSVISTFFGWNVLRVGSATCLTCSAIANLGTGERFETGLVDARLFRRDGGAWVKRLLLLVV